MTPTSERTASAEERKIEGIALRQHLGWDEESLEIILRQDRNATMEFHVGSVQDIWNHCISLRFSSQRLEAEKDEAIKEKVAANLALTIGLSREDELTNRIKELEAEVERICAWEQVGDTEWGREFKTSCGESLIETEDQKIEPNIVFCYKCGGKVRLHVKP